MWGGDGKERVGANGPWRASGEDQRRGRAPTPNAVRAGPPWCLHSRDSGGSSPMPTSRLGPRPARKLEQGLPTNPPAGGRRRAQRGEGRVTRRAPSVPRADTCHCSVETLMAGGGLWRPLCGPPPTRPRPVPLIHSMQKPREPQGSPCPENEAQTPSGIRGTRSPAPPNAPPTSVHCHLVASPSVVRPSWPLSGGTPSSPAASSPCSQPHGGFLPPAALSVAPRWRLPLPTLLA